jgi:hypothetical protein
MQTSNAKPLEMLLVRAYNPRCETCVPVIYLKESISELIVTCVLVISEGKYIRAGDLLGKF